MTNPETLDFDTIAVDHAISLYRAKVEAINGSPSTDAMFDLAALAVNIVPVLVGEIEAVRRRLAAMDLTLAANHRATHADLPEGGKA